jgi:hypothetical protein
MWAVVIIIVVVVVINTLPRRRLTSEVFEGLLC